MSGALLIPSVARTVTADTRPLPPGGYRYPNKNTFDQLDYWADITNFLIDAGGGQLAVVSAWQIQVVGGDGLLGIVSGTGVTAAAVVASAVVPLVSAAGIGLGMMASGAGVPFGVSVVGVSGNTLTLSAPVTVAIGATLGFLAGGMQLGAIWALISGGTPGVTYGLLFTVQTATVPVRQLSFSVGLTVNQQPVGVGSLATVPGVSSISPAGLVLALAGADLSSSVAAAPGGQAMTLAAWFALLAGLVNAVTLPQVLAALAAVGPGLPTMDVGLARGQLWWNSGFVCISSGSGGLAIPPSDGTFNGNILYAISTRAASFPTSDAGLAPGEPWNNSGFFALAGGSPGAVLPASDGTFGGNTIYALAAGYSSIPAASTGRAPYTVWRDSGFVTYVT